MDNEEFEKNIRHIYTVELELKKEIKLIKTLTL